MKRLEIGLKERVRARPLILRQRMPSSFGVARTGKLSDSGRSHLPASIGLVICAFIAAGVTG